ncbi:hypothetical protein GCM10020295_82680 [Streptomyces cinereospinus]
MSKSAKSDGPYAHRGGEEGATGDAGDDADAVEEIAVVKGAQAAEVEGCGAGAAARQGEAEGAGHEREPLRGTGTGRWGADGVAAGPPRHGAEVGGYFRRGGLGRGGGGAGGEVGVEVGAVASGEPFAPEGSGSSGDEDEGAGGGRRPTAG